MASYSELSAKGSILGDVAQSLRETGPSCPLSPLVFMTDPNRMTDPAKIAAKLPKGTAIIYRHFGSPDHAETLRDLTRNRGQQFLIGNDPELAKEIGADGVHFSRDATLSGPKLWREKQPNWIITMAGLKTGDYLSGFEPLDALFISSVFPSKSPSAGESIGSAALEDRAARLPLPIYALGGITAGTTYDLAGIGVSGLAAIDGLIWNVCYEETDYGHRFVIHTDFGEAEITMKFTKDGLYKANHTFTPPELRGQGVAGKLFDAMVGDAIHNGYKIIPGCPYIAVKFKRNLGITARVGVTPIT